MNVEINGINIEFDDVDVTGKIGPGVYGVLDENGYFDEVRSCLEQFEEYLFPEYRTQWVLILCEMIIEKRMVNSSLLFYVECINDYYCGLISEIEFCKKRDMYYGTPGVHRACEALGEEWVVFILMKDPARYSDYCQAEIGLKEGMEICFDFLAIKGCPADYLLQKLQARFPNAEVAL